MCAVLRGSFVLETSISNLIHMQVAMGATLAGTIYGIWRLVKEHGKRARSADASGDKKLTFSNERPHKRSMRLWTSEDHA